MVEECISTPLQVNSKPKSKLPNWDTKPIYSDQRKGKKKKKYEKV